MKKCLISIILVFSCLSGFSQTERYDVCIGVICPESLEHFSQPGLLRLSQKLTQIATVNGVAAINDGAFIMYPTLSVYDIQRVEGGMRNIVTVKIDLSINVAQLRNRTVIGSISMTIIGNGFSIEEATANAMSNIDANNKRYSVFISDCKKRIYDYDEQYCKSFILKAKSLASQHLYEEALAQLALYPEVLPSYPKVYKVTLEIFKEYQKQKSAELVQEARAQIAVQDYESAAQTLALVDPESPSYKESVLLLNTIMNNVEKQRKEEIQRELKRYDSKIALNKYRINAAKEIAKAYYSNKPQISYYQIIK
ncbi:MAG: hypothetical protein IKZ50_00825 [Bacteroidales bacterium]|nr:hypothetical protein [Bacteroidales bacterium]